MSLISKWCKHMCTVPARVYFVAAVFALSTVYVSQEAGLAFAQSGQFQPPPPMGGNFQGPPPGGQQMGAPQMGGQQGGQFGQQGQMNGPQNQGPMGNQKMDNGQFGQQGSEFDKGIRNQPVPGMQGGQFDQGIRNQPMPGQQGPEFDKGIRNQPMQGGQPGQMGPQGQGPMGNQKMDNGQFGQKDQMNNNGQFGKEGQMGMNGQNGKNQNSGEDFDKQQEKMQAQQDEQMKKQFAQMKKQFGQMGSMLKKVEARIAAVEKQGVKAPTELSEALASAKTALATIQSAQTMDDDGVQDAMSTLSESGQTFGEGMQKLEMLSQMPKMMKQAASEIKKLETAYAKSAKSAARLKIDVSAQLTEFRAAVDAIKAGYAEAQQLLQSGDAEGASEALQSSVWENMQDAYQYPGLIEALGNVRKYVATFDKFIAKAAKNKALAGNSEATSALSDMREKVAELKQAASRPTDPEELRSAVSDIFELQSTIESEIGGSQQNGSFQSTGSTTFDFSSFGQASGSQGQR